MLIRSTTRNSVTFQHPSDQIMNERYDPRSAVDAPPLAVDRQPPH